MAPPRCLVCSTRVNLTTLGGETCCESCVRDLIAMTAKELGRIMEEGKP